MKRNADSIGRAARLFLGVSALLACLISTPATALDLTFDAVPSSGNPSLTSLVTDGYMFTSRHFRTIDSPGGTFIPSGSAVYLGQEGGPGAQAISMARSDGKPFAVYEVRAAELFLFPTPDAPNAQLLSMKGALADGGAIVASFALGRPGGIMDFHYFLLPAAWANLDSVSFSGLRLDWSPGALALDDIGVGAAPSPVAEPSTFILGISTLGMLVALVWRQSRRI